MVIAERVFTAGDNDVRLEVFRPEPDPRGDYRCCYTLRGAGLERDFRGYGVDPMQALLLALANAHVDLLAFRRDAGIPITWLDMRDLGLPLASGVAAADFDRPSD
jgi:hypothetical protein